MNCLQLTVVDKLVDAAGSTASVRFGWWIQWVDATPSAPPNSLFQRLLGVGSRPDASMSLENRIAAASPGQRSEIQSPARKKAGCCNDRLNRPSLADISLRSVSAKSSGVGD